MSYLAIAQPIFQPAFREITAITRANPAQVTTSFNHQYLNGTIVRLVIPFLCGMQQANNLTGTISNASGTTFNIDINTTLFDSFVYLGATSPYQGQVVPIGEVNSTLAAATVNVLPFQG